MNNLKYSLLEEKEGLLYQRGDKKVTISKGLKIEELPILSINEKVTQYFGIVFDSPISVNPESKMKIYVKLPVDLGIFVSDGSSYKLIDTIEIYPKKYALYGNIGNGTIYRYWKTSPYLYEIIPNQYEALTSVEIINEADSIGVISLVIFDSKNFSLYKKESIIVGEEIQLHRLKKGLAVVKLTNKPSVKESVLLPVVPPKMLERDFEMSFGT